MRMLGVLFLILSFGFLGFGVYLLWLNLPGDPVEFQEYSADIPSFEGNNSQFYSNMRYRDKVISYSIEDVCNVKKREDAAEAFSILSESTVLRFFLDEENSEIRILCSDLAPEPKERGHFVAGEGGPSEVINASLFNVILSGKVSLFRTDKCEEPQIAMHEILHALGFDHNNNPGSIMNPVTNCNQEVDSYIIEEINDLYSKPSLPDLIIEKTSADKIGRYLDFEIIVSNIGLKDSKNASLVVKADSSEVKEFSLGIIEIGTKRILTVENVRVPRKFDKIVFSVVSDEPEFSKDNNEVEISVVS